MTAPGDQAPAFSAKDQDGNTVSLAAQRGRKVILYFYPKDDTPGCTKEACGFRDHSAAFAEANAVILGVSPDDEASHRKFVAKFGLPFALLADPDHVLCDAYGVWQEKSMYGRKYMGVVRSTFVIDERGILVREVRNAKVDGHVEAMLDAVR